MTMPVQVWRDTADMSVEVEVCDGVPLRVLVRWPRGDISPEMEIRALRAALVATATNPLHVLNWKAFSSWKWAESRTGNHEVENKYAYVRDVVLGDGSPPAGTPAELNLLATAIERNLLKTEVEKLTAETAELKGRIESFADDVEVPDFVASAGYVFDELRRSGFAICATSDAWCLQDTVTQQSFIGALRRGCSDV